MYELTPWVNKIEDDFPDFMGTGTVKEFFCWEGSSLLYCINERLYVIVSSGPSSFDWHLNTPVFSSGGELHKEFDCMGKYREKLLLRSTGVLFSIEPASSVLATFPALPAEGTECKFGPPWPHTHTLDVKGDGAFLMLDGSLRQISYVTINGFLQWQKKEVTPDFFIVRSVPEGSVFSAAVIADFGANDGRTFAITFPPSSRQLGINLFNLDEKHKNIISNLKIKSEKEE